MSGILNSAAILLLCAASFIMTRRISRIERWIGGGDE